VILIVGAGGFLGKYVVNATGLANRSCLKASRSGPSDLEVDLAAPVSELPSLPGVSHGIILASITSFDTCFRDPVRTRDFNVHHTIQLVEKMAQQGVRPVFISSDVVFDGNSGDYTEEDTAEPLTEYGKQKRAVEKHITDYHPGGLIIRFGKLYSLEGDDTSPVRKIREDLIKGKAVQAATDQYLSPVLVNEAAEGILKLIGMEAQGVFHLSPGPNGVITRHDMASMIAASIGADPSLVAACHIADFDFDEPRPKNSTLNGNKFRELSGMHLTPFCDAIKNLPDQAIE
jgi:dTDP-4-dehydrorhamnose reductase